MKIFLFSIVSFIISICFALYYGIRGKKLLGAGICGFFGYMCFEFLRSKQYSFEAFFLAACVIAACSELMARILRAPVTVFLVPALLPIVPGAALYNMMFLIIQGEMSQAASAAYQALIAAGAIVSGIVVISTLMKLIPRRKEKAGKISE